MSDESATRSKRLQFRLIHLFALITVCALFVRQHPIIAAVTLVYVVGLWIIVRDIVSYQRERLRSRKRSTPQHPV